MQICQSCVPVSGAFATPVCIAHSFALVNIAICSYMAEFATCGIHSLFVATFALVGHSIHTCAAIFTISDETFNINYMRPYLPHSA